MGRKHNLEVYYTHARIAGVDLPREKRVEVGLTYDLRHAACTTSQKMIAEIGINPGHPGQGSLRD